MACCARPSVGAADDHEIRRTRANCSDRSRPLGSAIGAELSGDELEQRGQERAEVVTDGREDGVDGIAGPAPEIAAA